MNNNGMHIEFAPRGIVQVDHARIIHRNFEGRQGEYNREGDRNFSLLIDSEEVYEALRAEGWNVKRKDPREDGDLPLMYLPVKVRYNDRGGPRAYLLAGKKKTELDEESIACLDDVEIDSVDLDIRPYDWERNGKTGRTAYLLGIHVTQKIDRFAARYIDTEDDCPWN